MGIRSFCTSSVHKVSRAKKQLPKKERKKERKKKEKTKKWKFGKLKKTVFVKKEKKESKEINQPKIFLIERKNVSGEFFP